MAEGIAVGRALMASVNICWSTSPSPWWTSRASPMRMIGTSALMTSSRRTMMKSTWVTVCATGWRCISRARARYVPEPVSRDRSWLAPASLLRAMRSSRATMATGQRVGPVAVDHGRDLPFASQAAHGARARGAPDFGGEYDFGHGGSPQWRERWSRTAPGLRRTAYQRSRAAGRRDHPPPQAPRPGCPRRRARRPRCPRRRRRWRRR